MDPLQVILGVAGLACTALMVGLVLLLARAAGSDTYTFRGVRDTGWLGFQT